MRCASRDLRIAFYLVAENHGFSNFLHGLAFLSALPLQGEIGLLFAQSHVALQNAFGTLDKFAGLQFF